MKKLILIICISIFYADLQAQDIAWLLAPSSTYESVTPFSEGTSVVRKGGKYYFLDKQMRLSSDSYLYAYPMSQGMALVQETQLGKRLNAHLWRFRQDESRYIGGEYEAGQSFQNGLAAIKRHGVWGFINLIGAESIMCQYAGVRPFNSSWTGGVAQDNKTFIINTLGAEMSTPYAFVQEYSEGLAAAITKQGDIAYIDTLRHEVIPAPLKRNYGGRFSEGLAVVSDTLPNLSYIDRTGKVLYWYKGGTEKGSHQGKDVTENLIHDLHTFSDGLSAVRQFGKWGFINPNGMVVIPFHYDEVTRFSEGLAAVKQNGQWHYINKAGYIAYQGKEEPFLEAQPCSEQLAWVRTHKGWGLLAIGEKLEIVVHMPFKGSMTPFNTTMKAHISSHRALKTATWMLNGTIVASQSFPNNTFEADLSTLLDFQSGKNTVRVIAHNAATEKINECVIYCHPNPVNAIPYQAVFVANNDYQDSNTWGSLETDEDVLGNPIAGADSLASVLHEKYQFRQIFIAHNATLAQMQSLLHDLEQQQDSMMRTLFFYAGHGDFEPTNKQAFMVPTDANGRDHKTHLSASYFARKVESMPLKHVLTMIDACYGGSFVLDVPLESGRGGKVGSKKTIPADTIPRGTITDKKREHAQVNLSIDANERLKSRLCIASGHRVEVPNTSDFIIAFLRQLIENQDINCRAGTMFERFKATFGTTAPVPQYGILPNAGSDGGDFIFRKQPLSPSAFVRE
ncbi:MAG: hypothetical protein RL329_621 [Bacteroidota bacterium]